MSGHRAPTSRLATGPVQTGSDPLVPERQTVVYSLSRRRRAILSGLRTPNRLLPAMLLPPRLLRRSALTLIAGSLLVGGLASAQQPRPSGAWRLDLSRSDSLATRFGRDGAPPAALMPGQRPGGDGPGGEGPGSMGPGYGPAGVGGPGGDIGGSRRFGGGRYGKGMSPKDLVRIRQTLDLLRVVPARVRISIADGTFTTMDSAGVEQTLRIGQTRVTPAVDSSGAVKTTARWKGDALIVEQKVDGGGRVEESYGVGLDGTRMIVFVELTIGMTPRSFTRQYVREVEDSVPR
jgi:hypothetical protein